MNRSHTHKFQTEASEKLRNLSFMMARKASTVPMPRKIGAVYFFDATYGWATRIMRKDPDISVARTVLELEIALADPGRHTILVPNDASMTRALVQQLCTHGALEKTVFFEAANE